MKLTLIGGGGVRAPLFVNSTLKRAKHLQVDTTGAGDCLNAGFIYGTLQNGSLADYLRFSNIVGGLATMHVGGIVDLMDFQDHMANSREVESNTPAVEFD